MTISVSSMQKIMSLGLAPEQVVAVMEVLAVELAPLEAKRNQDRQRQSRYRAKDNSVIVTSPSRDCHGDSSVIVTSSRVEDNTNLSFPSEDLNLTLSLSKPPSVNPRASGTNPRALGTNPRAIAQEPEDFAAFMAVYPKRAGAIDRKAALKAFAPALKRADFETIMHGAKRYNSDMTASGKVGTEYVKQARTWLNADGWQEYATAPQVASSKAPEARTPIILDSPAWQAWQATGVKWPVVDIRVKGRIHQGWYAPSEFPPQQETAA